MFNASTKVKRQDGLRARARVVRQSDGRVIAADVEVATSVVARFLGLMGRPGLAAGAGMWLTPCNGVHTCAMRFAIDVVHIDVSGRVLAVRSAVRPWRLVVSVRGAHTVLELPRGAASMLGEGDCLVLELAGRQSG